jgi:gluconate 2-dehydrogenase gamma chain
MDQMNEKAANGSKNGSSGEERLSRRGFLKSAGASLAGLIGLSVAGGCDVVVEEATTGTTVARLPQPVQYPAVPFPPAVPPQPGRLRFFNLHEARTVEAYTARLLPGTPEDPGAREAGVTIYIDSLLSTPGGFAEPTYRFPPFAETYEGSSPPPEQEGEFQVIWVAASEIDRYGYQSIYTPGEALKMGLAAIDRYANERFENDFVDLEEGQQDEIIQEMLDGEATGFEPLSATTLFHILRRYTAEGMFSDPVYGGNRGLAGWRLIGYPGAQRAYLPGEIKEEGSGLRREVWSLQTLPHFHPGQPVGPRTVLPVRGSGEEQHP